MRLLELGVESEPANEGHAFMYAQNHRFCRLLFDPAPLGLASPTGDHYGPQLAVLAGCGVIEGQRIELRLNGLQDLHSLGKLAAA
ncbi:hypothetical protein ABZ297_04635 [Nonomuraea sp. NPDC005983]|uniref:hypothetical protein n=1 Tax=Nonomuraea sp. NPDC005983 TaxID=3155595 RepID=UPI0033A459E9